MLVLHVRTAKKAFLYSFVSFAAVHFDSFHFRFLLFASSFLFNALTFFCMSLSKAVPTSIGSVAKSECLCCSDESYHTNHNFCFIYFDFNERHVIKLDADG